MARARAALVAELQRRKITATGYRLLGYNGPGTPRAKATWDLQAILPRLPEARTCPAGGLPAIWPPCAR